MSSEGRKYFFDLNNFDGSSVPEPEEDLPPPPPVFSENELEEAKRSAFEEGRIQGQHDEQKSRAQYIATQISELNTQILSLVLSEQMREKKFEQEVLYLCRALVKKMFPVLTVREGYVEIESVISRVILAQTAPHIEIEVPTDDLDDIRICLMGLRDVDMNKLRITGNPDLAKGNCRMKWQDGGAVRDHQSLSEAIFAQLDVVLAPPPQKVQNRESESEQINGDENG